MTRDEFIVLLDDLVAEYKHSGVIENPDTNQFLEAMAAWLRDTKSQSKGAVSWEPFAEAVQAGLVYE